MDHYLVVGNPIAQSKSPFIHELFAKQLNQHMDYRKELIEIDDFESAIRQLQMQGIKGINVTAPFKEQALKLCDRLSEHARQAGAVNTLTFCSDGSISGDNTDGLGLVNDLLTNNVQLKDASILLLGAGGAAKGVVKPILSEHPRQLIIANRTQSKAQDIVNQYQGNRIQAAGFDSIPAQEFDVVINATSAGLSGGKPSISGKLLGDNTVAYDMIYSDKPTVFNLWALEHGAAKVIDGLGMLVGQAAESFYIWRQVKPDYKPVLAMLRAELAGRN